tara:strand:- start:561 stop:1013 length:453 start_codon:yes stop_codon:yes gene_type:complete
LVYAKSFKTDKEDNLKYNYFNDFFDDKFINDLTSLPSRRVTKNVYPQCNISQSDDGGFNFHLYVPGFSRNDFTIDVKNNVLTARGKIGETSRTKFVQQEFTQYTSFERSWTLPQGVNVSGIDATYNAGVLEISVPLLQERKPETKTITVQ